MTYKYDNLEDMDMDVRIEDPQGVVSPENVVRALSEEAGKLGVPMNLGVDDVVSGTFKKTTTPCVTISHPQNSKFGTFVVLLNRKGIYAEAKVFLSGGSVGIGNRLASGRAASAQAAADSANGIITGAIFQARANRAEAKRAAKLERDPKTIWMRDVGEVIGTALA